MTKSNNDKKSFVRFSRIRCVEHAAVIVTFFLLVITGLPQKFYQADWSIDLVKTFGGVTAVRVLHRIVGALFTVQLILHVGYGLWTIWVRRRIPDIAPTMKDVRDAIVHVKHSLRLTKEKPRFGRFEFGQKFEYWGMLVGGSLMIVTGWILWKPILFASFLPAELIPVARLAHSNEAYLAFMVILCWHFYSVIFNPTVFPLDTTMFTGRMSKKRMKEEHPLEYEALEEKGEE